MGDNPIQSLLKISKTHDGTLELLNYLFDPKEESKEERLNYYLMSSWFSELNPVESQEDRIKISDSIRDYTKLHTAQTARKKKVKNPTTGKEEILETKFKMHDHFIISAPPEAKLEEFKKSLLGENLDGENCAFRDLKKELDIKRYVLVIHSDTGHKHAHILCEGSSIKVGRGLRRHISNSHLECLNENVYTKHFSAPQVNVLRELGDRGREIQRHRLSPWRKKRKSNGSRTLNPTRLDEAQRKIQSLIKPYLNSRCIDPESTARELIAQTLPTDLKVDFHDKTGAVKSSAKLSLAGSPINGKPLRLNTLLKVERSLICRHVLLEKARDFIHQGRKNSHDVRRRRKAGEDVKVAVEDVYCNYKEEWETLKAVINKLAGQAVIDHVKKKAAFDSWNEWITKYLYNFLENSEVDEPTKKSWRRLESNLEKLFPIPSKFKSMRIKREGSKCKECFLPSKTKCICAKGSNKSSSKLMA